MARKAEKIICNCCSKELRVSEFYKSNSKLNLVTGKLPICKSCLQDRYNELLTIYEGNSNDAWRHICFNLDIFYDENLYIECSSKDNFIGEYFRLLSTKDRKDKTSLNNTLKNGDVNDIALEDGVINSELIDFWGEGYSASEYNRLERKYKKYTKHYPSEKLQEQEIIRNLCELEMMRENCRISGDKTGYDKVNTQIRKSMDDLNVLPSKMQKYGEDKNLTIGKLIETIEKEEPIPDVHPEFDDIDKIKWMLDRYFINPFKKVFGLDNTIDYEKMENDTYEESKNKRKK